MTIETELALMFWGAKQEFIDFYLEDCDSDRVWGWM